MLIRLLRHEWRETWKIPALTVLIILVMTLVCVICFNGMVPPTEESALNAGAFFLLMVYCVMISCLSIVLLLYIAVRFYRNLYTDEGYLMHTLPVTPRELILSKLITGSAWYLVMTLLTLWATLVIMTFGMPVMVSPKALGTGFTLDWITLHFKELFGMSGPAFVLLQLVMLPVSAISSVLLTYAAISLGQLFSKHKVMGSVLCYIGFTMLMSTVTSLVLTPYMTRLIITSAQTAGSTGGSTMLVPSFMGSFMRTILLLSTAGSLISAVLSYIVTEYIMKKQLNLD